jgi:tetratricopeptide (TPR) repeat protein
MSPKIIGEKLFPFGMILTVLLWSVGAQSQSQESASALFERAQKAMDERQFTTALAHLNECLRKDPYFQDAYLWRARMRQRANDPLGAITDYSIFLEQTPGHAEALFSRGTLRFEVKQYAQAREDFQRLLRASGLETNTVFFQMNPYEGAKQVLTTQSGGIKPLVYGNLGMIEVHLKNYPKAILYLDSALALQPKVPEYLLNKGLAWQYSGEKDQAIATYQKVLEEDPSNALAKHNLAQLSRQQGNARQAEDLLSQAIEENPSLPFAYAERGFLRMNENNMEGAISDYTQAILIDPTEPDYFVNRGILYERQKKYAEAIRNYNQAIKVRNTYALAWLNRGNAHLKLNKIKEAIDDYTVAITFEPDYGLAYLNRAVAFEKWKKTVEACRDARQAEKLKMTVSESFKKSVCR